MKTIGVREHWGGTLSPSIEQRMQLLERLAGIRNPPCPNEGCDGVIFSKVMRSGTYIAYCSNSGGGLGGGTCDFEELREAWI